MTSFVTIKAFLFFPFRFFYLPSELKLCQKPSIDSSISMTSGTVNVVLNRTVVVDSG